MGEKPEIQRETWTRKFDFLLACIGFSVGLGNVWRFPYLCYNNGGGAFLIPYFICVIVGGIPIFFLEVALGQFMAEGGPKAWRICPILQGIGVSTTVIVFYLNCYYNVILAWAFYYMFASFTSKLPWTDCDNYWNTECCRETVNKSELIPDFCTKNFTDPTTEFWENKVLDISGGIDEVGEIKWDLAVTLVIAWFVVYFCICQGIRSSGKVMYVTATSPYIFMAVLLVRGCLLDGAREGILYYLVPDFDKLKDIQVWVDAGTQIFFSYSIGIGALTALGSYNKFNHNSYRDSVLFACANSGTSFLAGFVIFSVLGFMAQEQGKTVDDVAKVGAGLAFVAYPKALAQLPVSPLWSFLFFLMVILLGLDSQFVGVEGLITAFVDTFPSLRKKYNRVIFVGVMCVIQCIVGLSMITNGGMYVFQLFDFYTGSRIILLVGLVECIAVAYIYGIDRFYDNLEMMYGFRPGPYIWITLTFTAPAFCLSCFIMNARVYSELSYNEYIYPDWAVAIGWCLAVSSAVWIPVVAIWNIIKYMKQGISLIELFRPQNLKDHQLRPQDKIAQGIHMKRPDFVHDFRGPEHGQDFDISPM